MRKYLLVILILFSLNSSAQLALKGYAFRPLGDLGALMNRTFTGELMYMGDFTEGALRARVGICWIPLKSRLDTFPVYATGSDGFGEKVYPGWQVYDKYNLSFLSIGLDLNPQDKDPFFWYIGGDILIGGINMEFQEHYETKLDYSFTGGQLLAGLRFRQGMEYVFNDSFGVFLEASETGYYLEETGLFSYWDFGAGVHFIWW